MSETEPLYLGLDLGTQSLKAIVMNSGAQIIAEASVTFDVELPAFRTTGGCLHFSDGVCASPTLMWVAAVDMVFEQLSRSAVPLDRIVAVSGSAQQHGSVWFASNIETQLQLLWSGTASEQTLSDLLANAFSRSLSPVWLDSSTREQCRRLEEAVGGPQALAGMF
jgi:xylulokinase